MTHSHCYNFTCFCHCTSAGVHGKYGVDVARGLAGRPFSSSSDPADVSLTWRRALLAAWLSRGALGAGLFFWKEIVALHGYRA